MKTFKDANNLLQYLKLNPPDAHRAWDQRIFAFDIEVSSGWIPPGSDTPEPFDYSKDPVYYRTMTAVSICYLWQFAIDDVFFYGRELRDLIPVFDLLATQKIKTVCWIHNLSYEFQFLAGIIKFTKVFARNTHKPIYAEYGSLQFRCTYMLTRQKLESIGNNVGLPKLTEIMDYNSIFHPASDLPENVIKYGLRDVAILVRYIRKMVQHYKFVQKIPLTQTGIPRKDVKDLYRDKWFYKLKMARLVPTYEQYMISRQCFCGGWVHANYQKVNQIIKNGAAMADIASSYPRQMLKKYPMTPWSECSKPEDFDYYLTDGSFLCMVYIRAHDIMSAGANDYWSESKILSKLSKGVQSENGRIYKAKEFYCWITCIDYKIMKRAYKPIPGTDGGIEVVRLLFSKAGYLDISYIEYMLDRYNDKVLLTGTGDPVKEELRARSKERLNALYGMFVSALVYLDVNFDNKDGSWTTPKMLDPFWIKVFYSVQLNKLKTNNKKIATLFSRYEWGVYCTAYAREQLYNAVELVTDPDHEKGSAVIYHDTDSIYFEGDFRDVFRKLNEENHAALLEMCNRRGIDPERVHPNGLWIGDWEIEQAGDPEGPWQPFSEFKVLGAKRYAYRKKPTDAIKITVAGVNKTKGVKALHDSLNNFTDRLTFDYDEAGKLIPHYNTNQPDCTWIDDQGKEYRSTYAYGIALQPARYDYDISSFLETLLARGSLSDQLSDLSTDELNDLI